MSEKKEEKMQEENKISKFTCETKKIFNRLKDALVEDNRKIFQGKGCVFSTELIDKLELNDLDFFHLFVEKNIPQAKYDYAICVCREIMSASLIEEIMGALNNKGFIVFYCANPHYVINDNYNLNIETKIKNSEIMHDFLVRIKNIQNFDFEIIDAMSIPMKIPFINCDLENNEYFYQVIIKISNNLFGRKNLNDEAQLVSLDD